MFLRMTDSSIVSELKRMGCSPEKIGQVERSCPSVPLKMSGLSTQVASVVAKVASHIGLECILSDAESAEVSDVLLLGNFTKYGGLVSRLEMDCSKDICEFSEKMKKLLNQPKVSTRLGDGRILAYQHLMVMGIVNVTSDSFYGASCKPGIEAVLQTVGQMVDEGAEIIDLGAESTRPGAIPLTSALECERLIPAIQMIREKFPEVILSIDTYRAETGAKVIAAGAHMINDVSGGVDSDMAQVIYEGKVPIILMHLEANPQEMKPTMRVDQIEQVWQFLEDRRDRFVSAGVKEDQILLDPGIGFGKSLELNLSLMNRLDELKSLGHPVLLGASRKGTIGKVLGGLPTEERLFGTIGVSCQAVVGGAQVIRVHDVRENVQAIRMLEAVRQWG